MNNTLESLIDFDRNVKEALKDKPAITGLRITAAKVKRGFDKFKPKGFAMDTSKFDAEFAGLLNKACDESLINKLLKKANK